MVIAICDMKEEDAESQVLFWENLNNVMVQNGYPSADFAGFMVDEAGANWIAMRTVFNGGPDEILEGRERSCLFHWEQSLQKHTKKLVPTENRFAHLQMCEKWRLSHTMQSASLVAGSIREWWQQGNVPKENIKSLKRWFQWWEERIMHWGNQIDADLSPWERASIPNTNLSESVHASWLAGEGGARKISLYDACVTDVINSYIQCSKQLAFMTGRYIGTGPDMESLVKRVSSSTRPTPAFVARVMQSAVAGTDMYEEPILFGDKETVSKRKKTNMGASSHKPGFVMESRPRKQRGRPRKISFEGNIPTEEHGKDKQTQNHHTSLDTSGIVKSVEEEKIHRSLWAIRRMPVHCKRKCFGVIGKQKCAVYIESRSLGTVAPCFWSERIYNDNNIAQWMWFCNSNIEHTWSVDKHVKHIPQLPSVWPVDYDTNLTQEELTNLIAAGFNFKEKSITRTPQVGLDNVIPQPAAAANAMSSSKRSKKWRHGISKDAERKLSLAETMDVVLLDEKIILPKTHVVFTLLTEKNYEVHIKCHPSCACPDFQRRETQNKPYLACKHIYYVYTRVLGLNKTQHMVIHQPTLRDRDLEFILNQPRLIKSLVS